MSESTTKTANHEGRSAPAIVDMGRLAVQKGAEFPEEYNYGEGGGESWMKRAEMLDMLMGHEKELLGRYDDVLVLGAQVDTMYLAAQRIQEAIDNGDLEGNIVYLAGMRSLNLKHDVRGAEWLGLSADELATETGAAVEIARVVHGAVFSHDLELSDDVVDEDVNELGKRQTGGSVYVMEDGRTVTIINGASVRRKANSRHTSKSVLAEWLEYTDSKDVLLLASEPHARRVNLEAKILIQEVQSEVTLTTHGWLPPMDKLEDKAITSALLSTAKRLEEQGVHTDLDDYRDTSEYSLDSIRSASRVALRTLALLDGVEDMMSPENLEDLSLQSVVARVMGEKTARRRDFTAESFSSNEVFFGRVYEYMTELGFASSELAVLPESCTRNGYLALIEGGTPTKYKKEIECLESQETQPDQLALGGAIDRVLSQKELDYLHSAKDIPPEITAFIKQVEGDPVEADIARAYASLRVGGATKGEWTKVLAEGVDLVYWGIDAVKKNPVYTVELSRVNGEYVDSGKQMQLLTAELDDVNDSTVFTSSLYKPSRTIMSMAANTIDNTGRYHSMGYPSESSHNSASELSEVGRSQLASEFAAFLVLTSKYEEEIKLSTTPS